MSLKLINPGPSRRGWHRLQKALRCPRLYALAYKSKDGRGERLPSEPLIKGSLFHMALAHHYAQIQEQQQGKTETEYYSPLESVALLAKEQPEKYIPEWESYVADVQRVYLDYKVRWASRQWKVLAIEKEVCANIHDEERNETYFYTQRVDAIWEHPVTKQVWFVDHKTAGRVTQRTIGQYSMDGQMLGYGMFGQQMFGERYGGVLLNFIEWPKEGKSPRFERKRTDPAPYSVSRFKSTIIQAERIIRDHEKLEAVEWPGVHNSIACWPYGPCEFYETCQYGVKP